MVRNIWPVLAVLALVGGCMPFDPFKTSDNTAMPTVGPSPFGITPVAQTLNVASYPPSKDTQLFIKVDCISRKVKTKNRDTGLDPSIALIGTQTPEIFHQGTHVIWLSEGLVKDCKSEGELAALICLELGKMASEREASASFNARASESRPLEVQIGNAGQSATDGVYQVELAKFDKPRPKRVAPPDPMALARLYLEKAGYNRTELDNAEPLLRTASSNYVIEKQFKGENGPTWTPTDPSH